MSEASSPFDPRLTATGNVVLDQAHLVIVAPHPDDEVIGFGGAIFDHAAHGGRVTIVAVTDGESFDPTADIAGRLANAAERRAEQAAALAHLGVPIDRVIRMGFPDGALAAVTADLEDSLRGLFSSLDRAGGLAVVAPWRGDGHPDHEATSLASRAALGGGSLLEVPIWSWHRRTDNQQNWSSHAVLPISKTARVAKREALLRHVSQITPLHGGRPAILSQQFLEDFDRDVEVVCR